MGVSGARAFLRFSRSVSFCICPRPRAFTALAGARARGAAAEWEAGRAAARRAPAERAREGAQAREGARERAYLSVRLVLSCARARERVCVGARGCVPVRAPARSGGGGEGCSLPACTGDGSSSAAHGNCRKRTRVIDGARAHLMAAQVPSRSPSVATAQGRSKDSTPRLRRPCPRSCHRHPAVAHGGTDGARSDGAGGDQMDGVLASTAGEVADANSVSLDDERVSRGPGPIQRVRELLMREREFFRGGGGAMPLDNGSGGSWFGGGGSGDAGRRFLGGGGGGREDNDSEDEWRARLPGERRLLLGGWVPPVLLYYNKLLVSWFLDPEDYHTLAILADFGFLTFLGAMSLVTLISRTYAVAPFIIGTYEVSRAVAAPQRRAQCDERACSCALSRTAKARANSLATRSHRFTWDDPQSAEWCTWRWRSSSMASSADTAPRGAI